VGEIPDLGTSQQVLSLMSELVCLTDLDGRFTYVNPAWQRALGYSAAEARQINPADLVAPEDRGRYIAAARRVMAGETVADFEAVLLAKTGARVVCRGTAVPRWTAGPDGPVQIGATAVYANVTAERQADAIRARLANTLDASPNFVGMITAEGVLTYMNRGGRQLVGIPEDADISTYHPSQVHPPGAFEHLQANAFPAVRRDGVWRGETVLLGPDGEHIPVAQVIVAHPSTRAGEPPYFLSTIMHDLRDRVRAEAELLRREVRFRAAIDSSHDAFFLLRAIRDEDGAIIDFTIVDVNTQSCKLLSQSRDALIDQNLFTLYPASRANLARFAAVIDTGVPYSGEHRRTEPTVGAEWFQMKVVSLGEDWPDKIAIWSSDITAEKRQAAQFRQTLESVRALAITLDRDGNVTFVNDHALALTGWTRDEIMGTNWIDRVIPDPEPAKTFFAHVMRTGELTTHSEAVIRLRDGTDRLIAWDNIPLHDDTGTMIGVASLGNDVTSARRTEQLRQELIGIVSHELRTPIGVIRGALEYLRPRLTLEGRPKEFLQMASRNADQALVLVNDLLHLERLEGGAVPLEREIVSVAEMLMTAREGTQFVATSGEVAVDIDLSGAESAKFVYADGVRLQQVFVNLITNAVKFSPKGSTITLAAEPAVIPAPATAGQTGILAPVPTPAVRFSITDQGRGIPPEMVSRVFERFVQVYSEDASRKGGAGLGLAIAKAIVEQHGGRIWVESEIGVGSTFSFVIPSGK